MNASTDTLLHNELREELAKLLQVAVDELPGDVPPKIAGRFLSIAIKTLAVWRCTGRYNLSFFKAGSKVRYPVPNLIRFKHSRIHNHTKEVLK